MNSKKVKIISIVSIVALAAILVGATYAYFQAQTGEGAQTDIKINANTVDTFNFAIGNPLSINLNQENFASGKGNQTGSTYAKAILTANNKTNTATEHYYLYLNISNNTFLYTQNENTPELLLTITDASDNAVTDITSLTYKKVTDGKGTSISGYDITNKSGVITLFNNKEITASPTKTDEWNITVTLVNYDKDQSKNAGKNFSAKLMIQKEEYKPTLAEYVVSQYSGTQGDNGIYYHNSSLANGAGDNSYRYAGASDQVNNFVCFGSTKTPCPTDNLYRIIGVFEDKVKLIKYDYANSNLLGTNGAYLNDTKYKWSSLKTCPSSLGYVSNNVVFLAIPEATNEGCNLWNYSDLNKINLNTNYLNNIGTKWSNMIEDATWRVSGYSTESVTPSEMYTEEITNAPKTYGPNDGTSKIGLMYVSDYGFAASPSAWTMNLSYNSGNGYGSNAVRSVNWMYMGHYEWTMAPYSSSSYNVFGLSSSGYVSSNNELYGYGSRPVVYLKASVLFAGGSGTKDSPITLVV